MLNLITSSYATIRDYYRFHDRCWLVVSQRRWFRHCWRKDE
nr:MAG TPA: Protein of unknown function (DUF1378) [Microviridae sp.]